MIAWRAARAGTNSLTTNSGRACLGPEHHFLINRFGLAFEEFTVLTLSRSISTTIMRPIPCCGLHHPQCIYAARPEWAASSTSTPRRRWRSRRRQRAPAAVADGECPSWQHGVPRLRRHRPQSRRAPAPDPRSRPQIGDDRALVAGRTIGEAFYDVLLLDAPWRAARSWSPPRPKPCILVLQRRRAICLGRDGAPPTARTRTCV